MVGKVTSSPTVGGAAVASARQESAELLRQALAIGAQAAQESSASLGKQALDLLRQSVRTDATHLEAWQSFADALIDIDDQGWKRGFAVKLVGGGKTQFAADVTNAAAALQGRDEPRAERLAQVKR